jgi:hypothetical protein
MTKAEVLKYCKEKSDEGYMTHLLLLELFEDNEEIPDFFVDLVCHKPDPPKLFILFGSIGMIEQINQACVDYLKAKEQERIGKEFKDKICKS